MFKTCTQCIDDDVSSGDEFVDDGVSASEVEDDDAVALSYVGMAAYDVLRKKHGRHHHELWNVTSGRVVGEAHQTPLGTWSSPQDPAAEHDLWFPKKIREIMSRAQVWVDLASLGPPDGEFLEQIARAVEDINRTAIQKGGDPITIRMLFGNIVGMPVNCHAVIRALTQYVDEEHCNILLWVGAWRKGVSWNHAKIIAVDGLHLHTGGHNLWDQHYLKNNPVHDLSMEAEGRVAHDGHLFLNKQWKFIQQQQSGVVGFFVSRLPDNLPMLLQTRVTVSEFPEGVADEFPPMYEKSLVPFYNNMDCHVPIISMGRYGSLYYFARPSDDAIIAMLASAKTVMHLALQDLGPICIPGTTFAIPGCVWPEAYMREIALAIIERGVDVEIALSNPGSIPGGLSATEALYGNGWTCVDVAAEIVKAIRKVKPEVGDHDLRILVKDNLRVCYIKQGKKNGWADGLTMGMHAKHFIIDDRCYYVGSQNLYIADLAEWGLVIDDEAQTTKMMSEYWGPMWANSYIEDDCNVDDVMDGLAVDRNGESIHFASKETRELMERTQYKHGGWRSKLLHDEE